VGKGNRNQEDRNRKPVLPGSEEKPKHLSSPLKQTLTKAGGYVVEPQLLGKIEGKERVSTELSHKTSSPAAGVKTARKRQTKGNLRKRAA